MEYIKAKKRFGQNFLVDKNIQRKIIKELKQIVENNNSMNIVEVGPGTGCLTEHLALLDNKTVAFDIDPESVEYLHDQEWYRDANNLEILHQDFMKIVDNLGDYIDTNNFVFFSNLPYNIGSRLIVDLSTVYPQAFMAIMLQKEVVDKLCIKPNTKLTFIGSWMNLWYDFEKKFDIKPGSFVPAPNVDSSYAVGTPAPKISIKTVNDRRELRNNLKKIFRYPSKTIWNNIKDLEKAESAKKILDQAGISVGERLTWGNYITVLKAISE